MDANDRNMICIIRVIRGQPTWKGIRGGAEFIFTPREIFMEKPAASALDIPLLETNVSTLPCYYHHSAAAGRVL
jgi:hypothetical protein